MRKILSFSAISLLAIVLVLSLNHLPPRAAGQVQTAGVLNGVANQNVGMNGVQLLYNPNGTVIANGRCAQSIVTTAATTGQWALNYTALGFTTVTSYRVDALSPTTSQTLLSNNYTPFINAVNTTDISGTVTNAVSITILTFSVPIIQYGAASVQVSVGVCGS